MKQLSKQKRDRLILVALGSLAVLVGLYYGVIANQRNSLEQIAKKQVEKENKLQGGQHLVTSTPQIQQNLEGTLARLKAVESTMASGDLYSWIILTVNAFKENYKVEIPQFSREVAGEVGMYARFPYRAAIFHLRGTAYFHEFGRFVADFENTFPYMRIQNIELDPSTASSANVQSDAERLAFRMEIVALVNPNTH